MTVCEQIQNKIDTCTKNARFFFNKEDEKMTTFWLSARNGFIEQRDNLSLEEARKEMDSVRI